MSEEAGTSKENTQGDTGDLRYGHDFFPERGGGEPVKGLWARLTEGRANSRKLKCFANVHWCAKNGEYMLFRHSIFIIRTVRHQINRLVIRRTGRVNVFQLWSRSVCCAVRLFAGRSGVYNDSLIAIMGRFIIWQFMHEMVLKA